MSEKEIYKVSHILKEKKLISISNTKEVSFRKGMGIVCLGFFFVYLLYFSLWHFLFSRAGDGT